MTDIFRRTYRSTLDALVEDAIPDRAFEAWTFDDPARRRAAESRLRDKGVIARIHSAYKPLVFAFLEDIDLDGVTAIEVHYPVHESAPANRFRLEAYPLAALVGDRQIDFVAREDGAFQYDVRLTRGDTTEALVVLAPNRVHADLVGQTSLSPTGWYRVAGDDVGQRLETDYERLFHDTMEAIAAHDWGRDEPYFEELNIAVALPAADVPLPVGDEVSSLREALHEDFYFSLLEVFQHRSARPLGDRSLRPGQIVPEIVASDGAVSVRVETRPLTDGFLDAPDQDLGTAGEPIGVGQVQRLLADFGGELFAARSRAGRHVQAVHVSGRDAPVMVSGGQHPNEPTGIVGAMRAAMQLSQREGAHFVVSPLENPDGYALSQRLRRDNPRHMHHAARYTALGDDLEYRTRENAGAILGEKEIHLQAETRAQARLHVNLHGYPSHEWTRPLSGYLPRHFAMWTLPKGFFLIVRHHEGWGDAAEQLLDHVTRRLAAIPGLLEANRSQIALYEIHAGETGFRMINGFPCLSSVDDRHIAPVTLITEYPDETIYGAAYVAGHSAQMETVLAAYDAWQTIAGSTSVVAGV
ncbi:peptidase M14 [Aureimonas phyllosphaerae]|uniref:Zinc carboxypeptidase n=1 Tax=Aureimonas phyllosphaerae TaxID=1166078 RepID=A0A7W6FX91_9HYPH|nr:peptidase M14 [Aureimonas phyllosphaerae]MBB3937862.1 hypothetical protein [Aureimonas phyllosphaerae]MBB3961807.1 hypothetical protein [Aureimonas phyllosphaerae]SFF50583.1 hypothetical protein SAMN05216566_1195 [Aureimonas phyllosphaerae]